MKMFRGMAIFLAAVGLIGFAGCKRGSQGITIGYSTPDQANQYWNRVSKGIQDASDKNKIKVIITNASGKAETQLSDVEGLIQKQVDVILLSPYENSTAATCIKKANAAHIPVIIVDIGASGGDYASLIISDNKEGGRVAGNYVVQKLGGKGNVAHIQCQLGAQNAQLRGEGFEEITNKSAIKIVAKQPADSKKDMAQMIMENFLQAHPDINAVFAQNDEMAMGALRAIETSGKKGQILVVGFDGNPDAITSIKEGGLSATVAQQPELMGSKAVETALKVLKKEPVEKTVFVPVKLITKETAN